MELTVVMAPKVVRPSYHLFPKIETGGNGGGNGNLSIIPTTLLPLLPYSKKNNKKKKRDYRKYENRWSGGEVVRAYFLCICQVVFA